MVVVCKFAHIIASEWSKMKKGSYIVTVMVKAAGNNNYKASDVKTVKVTFKVK